MARKKFRPGVFIVDFLEDLEMTQEECAEKLGVSTEELGLIINGDTSITVELAEKLSKVLDTSVDIWINLQRSYDEYRSIKN